MMGTQSLIAPNMNLKLHGSVSNVVHVEYT